MCLLKIKLVVISIFYLFNIIMAQSDSPCPHIFNYRTEGASNYPALYGVLSLFAPAKFQGLLNVEMQISVGNLIGKTNGFIELITPSSQVEETIREKKALLLKVTFPYWINIIPKITKIIVNEDLICVGEPISAELVRETTGQLSKLNLRFKLQLNNIPSNLHPGGQPSLPQPQITTPQTQNSNPYIVDNSNDIEKYFTIPSTQSVQRPNFDSSRSCGIVAQTVSLIVGGDEIEEGSNPWLAALYKRRDGKEQFICGSNILSKRHAITAAHCVSGVVDIKRFSLALGRYDIYTNEGVQRALSNVLIHHEYVINQPDADLAILVMSEDVYFSRTIVPVCLWNNNINIKSTVETIGVVAGWGTDENGNVTSKPKQIAMPIVGEALCLRSSAEFVYITSNRTFCAGSRDLKGPCSGDSGGGFFVEINNKWFIRGIVSHALSTKNRTCDLSNYIVFADIAQHTEWIMSNIVQ